MAKGDRLPAESRTFQDEATQVEIRQITAHPSIHHQPFFLVPAYDDAMRWTLFTSARGGAPQIFVEDRATGELVQLTERDDVADFSIHPARDGNWIYFTTGSGGWRVHTGTFAEELLIDFAGLTMRDAGMVAAAMGTTALSRCDRYWAVRFKDGDEACIAVVDVEVGTHEVILHRDDVSHMQFCPDDSDLLFYAGPLTDRVWLVRRDGTGNRRLYERAPGQWITHEAWIPGTREVGFVDWPRGMQAVHVDTGAVRPVTSFNAWHAIASPDGRRMVADTNFPDIGIQMFDPRDGLGEPALLCRPQASSLGDHWNGPFPYEDGPIAVYAPQHTHPHPSFSPDGRHVIYTSDVSGHAQVYEATLPA
jgi:oligogalacturonide lyase